MNSISENYISILQISNKIAKKKVSQTSKLDYFSLVKYPFLTYLVGATLLSYDEIRSLFPSIHFLK
jgi:hypothetical protein